MEVLPRMISTGSLALGASMLRFDGHKQNSM